MNLPTVGSYGSYENFYVVIDWHHKYVHFIPCCNLITTGGMAQQFTNYVWKLYSFLENIITDKDLKHVSALWIHGTN